MPAGDEGEWQLLRLPEHDRYVYALIAPGMVLAAYVNSEGGLEMPWSKYDPAVLALVVAMLRAEMEDGGE